jgi:hypothetical protein
MSREREERKKASTKLLLKNPEKLIQKLFEILDQYGPILLQKGTLSPGAMKAIVDKFMLLQKLSWDSVYQNNESLNKLYHFLGELIESYEDIHNDEKPIDFKENLDALVGLRNKLCELKGAKIDKENIYSEWQSELTKAYRYEVSKLDDKTKKSRKKDLDELDAPIEDIFPYAPEEEPTKSEINSDVSYLEDAKSVLSPALGRFTFLNSLTREDKLRFPKVYVGIFADVEKSIDDFQDQIKKVGAAIIDSGYQQGVFEKLKEIQSLVINIKSIKGSEDEWLKSVKKMEGAFSLASVPYLEHGRKDKKDKLILEIQRTIDAMKKLEEPKNFENPKNCVIS